MSLPLYLAMTDSEIDMHPSGITHCAYMACRFSPSSIGLCKPYAIIPSGSVLMLDDQFPFRDHNPDIILMELRELITQHSCESLLLDFERRDDPELDRLASYIIDRIQIPIAAPPCYAKNRKCAVFLPPLPPDTDLKSHMRPWEGQEVWLEVALDGLDVTVTKNGAKAVYVPHPDMHGNMHRDPNLMCHYSIHPGERQFLFHLQRNNEDIMELMSRAEAMGVSRFIGLYQELHTLVQK